MDIICQIYLDFEKAISPNTSVDGIKLNIIKKPV